MNTDELREKYLEFFESKGHTKKPSDVLVPTWDPSVLFTPAGMNQFKDHFLGRVKLEFTRATTCQKCLRTGDIDNVGRTAYHHTFFEMLGNFSFGDYFKRDAIHWAWEFLTSKKWLGIEPKRLTVTVYQDDDEAAGIWANDIGLSSDRITRMGEDDNFWPASAPSQGPDGVCGPCSEIFFHPDSGKEVEIWNLVFTQFNRVGPPPNNLRPLPSKNIDTGMGLERCAAVLQGVETNYHIDILRPIVEAAGEICGVKYEPTSDNGRRLRRITDHVRACTFAVHENVYPGPNKEKYVIRRLLRRAVLDGHQMGVREPFLHKLVPVVSEMMKQPYPELGETAVRVARVIQQEEASFLGTIDAGLSKIEGLFADLKRKCRRMVPGEDVHFMYDTHGFPPELFEQIAKEAGLTFDWQGYKQILEGKGGGTQVEVFKTGPLEQLKQTVKSTEFLGYSTTSAEGRVVGIIAGNKLCSSYDTAVGRVSDPSVLPASRSTRSEQTGQRPVLHEEKTADVSRSEPAIVTVVLDRTPFYGESGGQVGDAGRLSGEDLRFDVIDTQRSGDLVLHVGHLRHGKLFDGQTVTADVDASRRLGIRRAHSATHLLHNALQKHLGKHAQQQGSKVDDDWLRFDFTNLEQVTREQLAAIEDEVTDRITCSHPVVWQTLPLAEARKLGAMMLFGEKYPDPVRMVSMGDFSRELCGGTHLDNTRQVENFEVLSEEGVSAGVRRIVALTGAKAREHERATIDAADEAAESLRVATPRLVQAVEALSHRVRDLKKQLATGQKPAASRETVTIASDEPEAAFGQPSSGGAPLAAERLYKWALEDAGRMLNIAPLDVPARIRAMQHEIVELEQKIAAGPSAEDLSADKLLDQAFEVSGGKAVVAEVPGANANILRGLIDQLRKQASPIAVLLAGGQDGKPLFVAGISRDLVSAGGDAGRWVRETATVAGGGGGGKPDMAQAGGKDASKLPQALEKARAVVREMIAG